MLDSLFSLLIVPVGCQRYPHFLPEPGTVQAVSFLNSLKEFMAIDVVICHSDFLYPIDM